MPKVAPKSVSNTHLHANTTHNTCSMLKMTFEISGSAEEKRLLVTKRIEAEDLFSKYSSKQAEPWK